jgi:3-oxoacyl-[acyl-carrier protein] reductase
MSGRRALVFGGTGAVGAEVVRRLAKEGVSVLFTYFRAREHADALASETNQVARPVDLRDAAAVRRFLGEVPEDVNVFVHCAATSRAAALSDLTDADWGDAHAVNVQAGFMAARELGPRMASRGGGRLVFVGALAPGQSAAVPVHFAATQGALSAMTMALAKELGPRNVQVNMVALGLLDRGLSRAISPKLVSDYKSFSALRRLGTAEEAARVIAWVALESSYLNGEVLTANGGV